MQSHSPQHDCTNTTYGPPVEVGLTGPISSSTTWANQPAWRTDLPMSGVDLAVGHMDYCHAKAWEAWELTTALKTVIASTKTITVGMRSESEYDAAGLRYFENLVGSSAATSQPLWVIDYNPAPNPPSNVQVGPAAGTTATGETVLGTLTPTASAVITNPSIVSCPAGQLACLRGRFEVIRGSAVVGSISSAVVQSGQRATVTVPAGLISGEGPYRIRAWAANVITGLESSDFAEVPVIVDLAPQAPTAAWTKPNALTPDAPVQVTVSNPSSDVTAYCWTADTSEGTTAETCQTPQNGQLTVGPFPFGSVTLQIRAKDVRGNLSAATQLSGDFLF